MTRPLVLALVAALASCARDKPTAPAHDHGASAPAPSGGPTTPAPAGHGAPTGYADVHVDSSRQQLLGIKTAPVERRALGKSVRTVGVVQADETRTAHVHVKFDGFIEQIYVDYTGRAVRKGQPLFKIFSRELLAAEQEYLSSRAALARLPAGSGETVRGAAGQLVSASRERLRLFDIPPGALREMERTGVAPRAITILSPQTGTVIEKQAVEGLAVTPMMHLYVVADLSSVWVVADVYERDIATVRVGQPAAMRIDALPKRAFEGKVTFVSPTIEQATRTAKIRFEFTNRDGALRPGMYATVEIRGGGGGETLAVASDSVIDTGERKIVFVVRDGGRFEPRAITTGASLDGYYEVIGGLHEGESIATSGQFLLDSESRIRGARVPAGSAHGGH